MRDRPKRGPREGIRADEVNRRREVAMEELGIRVYPDGDKWCGVVMKGGDIFAESEATDPATALSELALAFDARFWAL